VTYRITRQIFTGLLGRLKGKIPDYSAKKEEKHRVLRLFEISLLLIFK